MAVDLGPGRSHGGKHMLLPEMNSFHLHVTELGGMRPWGLETQSHSSKLLALAFCQNFWPGHLWSATDLSENSWDLCGPGPVLWDWLPRARGQALSPNWMLNHFRKGQLCFGASRPPRDWTKRSAKGSQSRGGARASVLAMA